MEILKDFKDRDSRIILITQEHNGVSSARNTGLKQANGDYIYFMDSDDILKPEALNNAYNICDDFDLDILIFKLTNLDDETNEQYSDDVYDMTPLQEELENRIFNFNDLDEKLFSLAVILMGKMFKRSLVEDMEFSNNLIFEDNPYFLEAMFKAEKVYFYNEYLYLRRRRKNSITNSNNLSFSDTIPVSNLCIDIAKKYNQYDRFRDVLFNRKIHTNFVRFKMVEEKYKNEFFAMLKVDFKLNRDEIDKCDLNNRARTIFESVLSSETYRELELKMVLFDSNNKINELKGHLRKTRAYEYSRIDIKNHGDESNSIEIMENSDETSSVMHPVWFKNNEGQGVQIESYVNSLDLKLKMIKDGKLRINLRSIDIRDENNERMKFPVDYTSLVINGKEYLKGHNLYWHDSPYTYVQDVNDSEIIQIHVEWMTYDKLSEYIDEINLLNEKNSQLLNKNKKLKNKLNKQVKEKKESIVNLILFILQEAGKSQNPCAMLKDFGSNYNTLLNSLKTETLPISLKNQLSKK